MTQDESESLHHIREKIDELDRFLIEWRGEGGRLGASQKVQIIWHSYAWVFSVVSVFFGYFLRWYFER